jgi:hypothetical protein
MDLLRLGILLASCIAIIIWIVLYRKNPRLRFLSIAVISWLAHIILFSLAVLIDLQITPVVLNAWSAAIRLHGIFLLIAGALVL